VQSQLRGSNVPRDVAGPSRTAAPPTAARRAQRDRRASPRPPPVRGQPEPSLHDEADRRAEGRARRGSRHADVGERDGAPVLADGEGSNVSLSIVDPAFDSVAAAPQANRVRRGSRSTALRGRGKRMRGTLSSWRGARRTRMSSQGRVPPMSTPKLTREDVRAFLDPPWHLFDEAHAKHRRESYEADPSAAFRVSEELWEEVRHHGYADGDRRRRDFEHHVRLRALLDRANLDHQAPVAPATTPGSFRVW
jgi:hypothetical protein